MIALAVMTLRVFGLWLHLLGVVVWLGTTVTWILALLTLGGGDRASGEEWWIESLGRRLYTVGWEAIFLIVLTGIFNLIPSARSGRLAEPDYYTPVLIKLGAVAGMIGLHAWQHGWLLSRLCDDTTTSQSFDSARVSVLVASGLLVVLGMGALWIGVSLRY